MSSDPSVLTHRALGEISRMRILEELRVRGALDSRELGRLVGLHPNTVRSHADQLIEAGLVRTVNAPAGARGRPRLLYQANEESEAAGKGGYRLLAQILATYVATLERPAAVAEEAGQAWGGYLAQRPPSFTNMTAEEATERVVELFSELGFMPEAVEDQQGRRVLLHHCPFREVAEANQQVACAVHLGMLKGALAEMGAPLEATRLEPFVQPTLCVAHLRRSSHGRAPGHRSHRRPAEISPK